MRAVCDRHFGVGADGVLAILPGVDGDARMRVLNADGSEAEMCGNGIRCVAKVLYDSDPSLRRPVLRIDTGAGLLACAIERRGRRGALGRGRDGTAARDPRRDPAAAGRRRIARCARSITARGPHFEMHRGVDGQPARGDLRRRRRRRPARAGRGVRTGARDRSASSRGAPTSSSRASATARAAPRSIWSSGSAAAASRSPAAPARARPSPPPVSKSGCARAGRRRFICRAARCTSPSLPSWPASACAARP